MTGFHLAQINVGRLRAPVDDPMIADFVANLDRINALADGLPGFVWRLKGEGNNATDIQPDDPCLPSTCRLSDIDSPGCYCTAHCDTAAGASGSRRWRPTCALVGPHRPHPTAGTAWSGSLFERLGATPRRSAKNPFRRQADTITPSDECHESRCNVPWSTATETARSQLSAPPGRRWTWSGTATPPCPTAST